MAMRRPVGLAHQRFVARFLVWIAICAVAVQLTGALHLAADVFGGHDTDGMVGDCADEKAGMDCVPGCPSCHCGHGGVAALPDLRAIVAGIAFDASLSSAIPYDFGVPPSPELAPPLRPPRS